MNTLQSQWQLISLPEVPLSFLNVVKTYTHNNYTGKHVAQLLWQRNIRDLQQLSGFISPDYYEPTSVKEFGLEMDLAVSRLEKALNLGEKVTIWGDFDADGVTSTAVLWEGLGQFFSQYIYLDYYIPNRLIESHGLNKKGIDSLAESGTKLIVTCDTGSTNIEEIIYANELGIDIIVSDHHTLPESRPEVVAIINPRYLEVTNPLYNLSGVAVAYKLVEALYEHLPDIPTEPIESLLDLVAIGLIADLVELKGDCRYLAQQGIKQLKKQAKKDTATRPGINRLLELCKRTGDRPTDISFGLGPRINAVSRIHGDASYVVELLTSKDIDRCFKLADETELANTRRKSLQKDIKKQVIKKLQLIDLSTTAVIVLEDSQWQGGVLGLVAGEIANEYGRPTILLNISEDESGITYARGSARSVSGIDLYDLVNSQKHLLHRFGGHPFAAGLSLQLDNLSLFKQGINQQLKQKLDIRNMKVTIEADLLVTVSELGQDLFRELSLLEPCGMGNPVPKLLIQDCQFKNVWNTNIKDKNNNKVQFLKTSFNIVDDSSNKSFPGVWWGHNKDELPQNINCDAIVELDFNTFKSRYEVRLIAVRQDNNALKLNNLTTIKNLIIDRRNLDNNLDCNESLDSFLVVAECPLSWTELKLKFNNAISSKKKLLLNYKLEKIDNSKIIWQQLLGIAKYLSRTKKQVTKEQLKHKLKLSDRSLNLGLEALKKVGFLNKFNNDLYQFYLEEKKLIDNNDSSIQSFLLSIIELDFQREYFSKVPLSVIEEHLTFNI